MGAEIMTLLLDNDLEQLISAKLATGKYRTASELVRESLRLLAERGAEEQQREAWRQDIALGLRQWDMGQAVTPDAHTPAGIKARGRITNHPLAALAGVFNDEPLWDEFLEATKEYRRRMNERNEAE